MFLPFILQDYDDLIDIIRRDELNVRNEENIFEACMRWIKWDEGRTTLLPQVLSKVRLPLLTPQFLADRVATGGIINYHSVTTFSLHILTSSNRRSDSHLTPMPRFIRRSQGFSPDA